MTQLVVMEWTKLPPVSAKRGFYKVWHAQQIKFRCIVAISRERGRQDTHRGEQSLKEQG
jgi:hypothetical protein